MNTWLKVQYNKIKSKVLEKPYLYGFWIIFVFLLMPLLIYFTYFIGDSGFVLIKTSLRVGEALGFYGSFLTFIGTVALGALALWQNKKANYINKRLSLLEKERFKLELQPFVLITNWGIKTEETLEVILSPKKLYIEIESKELKDKECLCLSIFLTNTSNAFTIVNYSEAEVYHNETFIENWSNATVNQPNTKLYLNSGESGEFVFYCSREKMKTFSGKKIKLELILENRFSNKYKETVDIIIAVLSEHIDNSWYLYINPQNYQINRFTKNKNGESVLEDEE